jgi:formylglycine-generating enzyme required for sulfatase activity
MLQARECACILILAAAALLPAHSYARQDDPGDDPQDARSIQRLGDKPVENEHELDLTVPPSTVPKPKPESAEERAAREASERQTVVERNLAAAARAEREGRIDQPPGDCAWFHYRAALDLDASNEEAAKGLLRVQEEMISRALELAREMDFESAERLLEDALLVREDRSAVDKAYEQVRDVRLEHAGELESDAVQAMDAGDFSRAERLLVELIALGEMDSVVNQLRRRLEEARVYGGFKPGQTVRDHFMNQATWTPESVIVTAGSFVMGSSAFEDGREENEGPEHRVTFRRGFAIGRTEVTVAQFRAFAERTGYRTDAEKQGDSTVYDHHSGRLAKREGVSWEMDYEGRKAKDDEPVVHVSWNDAQTYVRWLAQGTGKAYRLPTEAEFEYALRGGKTTRYWWGDGSPGQVVENLTGEVDISRSQRQWSTFFKGYKDGHWGPAPVASFAPNPFGLHDIGGNVGEWVMDCWHDTYMRAPVDGSAWVNPGCKLRVIRGGYWASSPDQARSAFRVSAQPDRRDARIGIRIARDL